MKFKNLRNLIPTLPVVLALLASQASAEPIDEQYKSDCTISDEGAPMPDLTLSVVSHWFAVHQGEEMPEPYTELQFTKPSTGKTYSYTVIYTGSDGLVATPSGESLGFSGLAILNVNYETKSGTLRLGDRMTPGNGIGKFSEFQVTCTESTHVGPIIP